VDLPDFVELGVFAAELLEFGRIPRGGGVGQLPGDLLRPRERLAESVVQGSARFGSVFLAEPLHAACRIEHFCLPVKNGWQLAQTST